MLNVSFKNNYSGGYKNNQRIITTAPKILPQLKNDSFISFKGNVDFVLVNKLASPVIENAELKSISNILKSLGVKELEIGDNLELARLLKSAMCRVKRLGFDVPTRIRCESKYFDENERIQKKLHEVIINNKDYIGASIPATISWNGIEEPIMYFNPKRNWENGNGNSTKSHDPRHIIWHETGHWLHMQNHKKCPQMYDYLNQINLNSYKKDIVKSTIGKYAADSPMTETIAEIFARLMSGEAYNKLHPEVFNIYREYKGPMPK